MSQVSEFHILPKAQVAGNKNAHNFWHHFPAQFFELFLLVWSILFGMLALKNTPIEAFDWLLKNFNQSESVSLG